MGKVVEIQNICYWHFSGHSIGGRYPKRGQVRRDTRHSSGTSSDLHQNRYFIIGKVCNTSTWTVKHLVLDHLGISPMCFNIMIYYAVLFFVHVSYAFGFAWSHPSSLQWIHEHKTAALLEFCVVGGGVLAGANQDEVPYLPRRYCRQTSVEFMFSLKAGFCFILDFNAFEI